MRRTWTAVCATACVLAACGGADGPSEGDLRAAFVDDGWDPAEARCFVGEIYDGLSSEDKEAIVRLDDEYEDFSITPGEMNEALDKCTGATDSDTTTSSLPKTTTTESGPPPPIAASAAEKAEACVFWAGIEAESRASSGEIDEIQRQVVDGMCSDALNVFQGDASRYDDEARDDIATFLQQVLRDRDAWWRASLRDGEFPPSVALNGQAFHGDIGLDLMARLRELLDAGAPSG